MRKSGVEGWGVAVAGVVLVFLMVMVALLCVLMGPILGVCLRLSGREVGLLRLKEGDF
jgi:hypothetical protein